jgi:hypothetical protein
MDSTLRSRGRRKYERCGRRKKSEWGHRKRQREKGIRRKEARQK